VRRVNVSLLTPFGSTAQQDHKPLSIPTKVNSVARSEIQPQLLHARADTLRRGNVTPFQPVQCDGNPGLSAIIETIEPSFEWIAPLAINVLANLNHIYIVAQRSPLIIRPPAALSIDARKSQRFPEMQLPFL
jgi:hypothetical protein